MELLDNIILEDQVIAIAFVRASSFDACMSLSIRLYQTSCIMWLGWAQDSSHEPAGRWTDWFRTTQ